MTDSKFQPSAETPDKKVREVALSLITTWVATIGDNVNNPVASILAAIDAIERERERQRHGDHCDEQLIDESLLRVRSRLQHLTEYVAELVNFGRPYAIEPTFLETQPCLLEARAALKLLPGAEVTITVAEGGDHIYADAVRLKSALKCLVTNGLEAAYQQTRDGGPPRVAIFASASTIRGQSGIVIHIDDNGPGFSDAAKTRGGEPFYSTKEAGTGLGLAIAKKAVHAHGGSLSLGTSPTLGGARATLFFPNTMQAFTTCDPIAGGRSP